MKQKIDDWKRLVYGEVYVPYRIDTDMEFATPEEIEKAAYYFMEQSKTGNVDSEHDFKPSDNIVVQSYIAKENDPDGFVAGSWIAVGLIKDDGEWEDVRQGKKNGWSMAGVSDKIPRKVKVTALKSAKIKTDLSTAEGIEPHSHDLFLDFNDGKVTPTQTSEVLKHVHDVIATTATASAQGHSHRYNVDWSIDSPDFQKEEREIEATELVEIKPRWLSLVEHAATRRAFKMVKAEWTSAYINDLPDSSFAIVERGYKEGDNKNARHLPYKDANGVIDLPHLRNALARCNQIKSVLGSETSAALQARALKVLQAAADKHLKTETEEVKPLDRVVHAIVSDLEFDDVMKLEELGWMVPSDIRFEERVRLGKSNKFVLVPSASFVKGSLETQDTPVENVKMIVGVLKEETTKNAISVPAEDIEKTVAKAVAKALAEQEDIEKVKKASPPPEVPAIPGETNDLEAMIEKTVARMLAEGDAMKSKENKKEEELTMEEALKKSLEGLKGQIEAILTPQVEDVNKSVNEKIDEIKGMVESLTKTQSDLATKTEELSQRATTMSGASDQGEGVVKGEAADVVGGWLFNSNNPVIQKILAS